MPHATLIDILERVAGRARPDLLRFKHDGHYRDLSATEFAARVRRLSAFFLACGVKVGDRVALLSENRPEWTIMDFAAVSIGAVNVPIYTTLSSQQIGYILRDAACRVACVSTHGLLEKLMLAAGEPGVALERTVIFDGPSDGRVHPDAVRTNRLDTKDALSATEFHAGGRGPAQPASGSGPVQAANVAAAATGPTHESGSSVASGLAGAPGPVAAGRPAAAPRLGEVTSLDEAYERGEAHDRRDPSEVEKMRRRVRPEDLASIIYTSGTTGDPKGVMLTHRNFCSNLDACLAVIPFNEQDTALSFLPLSHVFERMVEYAYLAAGGAIAFAGSFETVPSDIQMVRPTVVSGVPRLFEKTRARILEAVESGPPLKRKVFRWALALGRRRDRLGQSPIRARLTLALGLWAADRLVFSKIRARLGGRIRFFISGGAPLDKGIADFFLAAGITILEGYGLTETSPVVAVNRPGRMKTGTVGPILPGVEVRIAEDGEILVKGPNVMEGYFGKPEETASVMRGGYFATGDIGFIDAEGFLTITDRKKELLITSGGKNIAPQPIENALKTSRYIANAVLIGDGRNFISALVVPDFEALEGFAAARSFGGLPRGALIGRTEVTDLVAAEIEARTSRFAAFEKVRRFTLLERDFTLEADEITPTLKVKRRSIAENYRTQIDAMYGS